MQSSGALTVMGRPFVVGHARHSEALHGIAGHGARVAQRHVDAPVDGRRGAVEVEADAPTIDLGAAGEAKRVVDSLDVENARVDAVGEGRDALPDGPLALAADGGRERCEVVQCVLVHELKELARPDLVAGDVGHEVAEDLLGDPYVAADEGGDNLVGDTDEPIPHDGQAHRVDCPGAHESLSSFASSATRFRCASTVARSPGPSTQVDSRSSMTAGPSIVVPT